MCLGLGLCMGVWILQCKWLFSYSVNRHPLSFRISIVGGSGITVRQVLEWCLHFL